VHSWTTPGKDTSERAVVQAQSPSEIGRTTCTVCRLYGQVVAGSHGQWFLDRGLFPRRALPSPFDEIARRRQGWICINGRTHSQETADCGYPLFALRGPSPIIMRGGQRNEIRRTASSPHVTNESTFIEIRAAEFELHKLCATLASTAPYFDVNF